MEVLVSERATVDITRNAISHPPRAFLADGAGPFVGIILQAQDGGQGLFFGRAIGGTLGNETEDAWVGYTVPDWKHVLGDLDSIELPAGKYTLTTIGSGVIDVSLALGGVDGVTELNPAGSADVQVSPLPVRSPSGQNNLYWAGANGQLSRAGFVFQAMAAEFSVPSQVTDVGACFYNSHPPEETAFLPHCPREQTDKGDSPGFVAVAADNARMKLLFLRPQIAGNYGVGAWYAATGVPEGASAFQVWVGLDAGGSESPEPPDRVPTSPCPTNDEYPTLGLGGKHEDVDSPQLPEDTDFPRSLMPVHPGGVDSRVSYKYRLDLSGSRTNPFATKANVDVNLTWDNDGDFDVNVYGADNKLLGRSDGSLQDRMETVTIKRVDQCTDLRVEVVNALAPPALTMTLDTSVSNLKP